MKLKLFIPNKMRIAALVIFALCLVLAAIEARWGEALLIAVLLGDLIYEFHLEDKLDEARAELESLRAAQP